MSLFMDFTLELPNPALDVEWKLQHSSEREELGSLCEPKATCQRVWEESGFQHKLVHSAPENRAESNFMLGEFCYQEFAYCTDRIRFAL